jgi:hypothetical protein
VEFKNLNSNELGIKKKAEKKRITPKPFHGPIPLLPAHLS